MKAKLVKEKLNKKTPLLISPFGFALAACGGGTTQPANQSDAEINVRVFEVESRDSFNIDGIYHVPSWYFVDAADINQDGKSDVVIAPVGHVLDYQRAFDPIVLLSQSDNNFAQAEVLGDWDGLLFPSKVVISDLDLDGDLDFISSANGYDAPPFPKENFGIFLQDALSFTDVNDQYPTLFNSTRGDGSGSFYHSVAVGDLNHDTIPDIFMGDMRDPFIIDGATQQLISVGQLTDPNVGGSQILTSEAVDVVGDQKLELVLTGNMFNSQIFEFDAEYNIINVIELPAPNSLADRSGLQLGIAAGDLNNDGLTDLVLTLATESYSSGELQILIQSEASVFIDVTQEWLSEASSSYWTKTVKIVDIDADGDLDLLLGQIEPSVLNYYENVEGSTFVKKTVEDPMNGFGRFHVGIDEDNLNAYLVNNTSNGDLILAEVSFA